MMCLALILFTAPLWLILLVWPALKLLSLKGWKRLWLVPFFWVVLAGWIAAAPSLATAFDQVDA